MDQTPAHDVCNLDLLSFIPINSKKLIEIGCSSGAMAREFKFISPKCNYLGVEIMPLYSELAKRYCDEVLLMDIEDASESFFIRNSERDCWIFGDTLEHLRDPWSVLKRIRAVIPETGTVLACIPNVQHWTVQAKISTGDFKYQTSGLLDKTHLRFFTRKTIYEMFDDAGFKIIDGLTRILIDPSQDKFLPIIGQMAAAAGENPEIAIEEAKIFQFIIKAEPK